MPVIKVEDGDTATAMPDSPGETAGRESGPTAAPAGPQIIDLEEDMVRVKTLDRFIIRDEVFTHIRAAYKRIFMQSSTLILGVRNKKEDELRRMLHDTALAISAAGKDTFRDRSAKYRPAMLNRAEKVLGDDLTRMVDMEDEFLDAQEQAHFARIVAGR